MVRDDYDNDDVDNESEFLKKIVEALFKSVVGGLANQSGTFMDELNPINEIKLPHFEAVENGKNVNLLVEMPGAVEEDIVFSIVNELGNKFLTISTVDSLGEKYKAIISLPVKIKKVTKDHFTNGILELILS